ncbi:MAG: MBL fold metallo-hydrolase [Armatimonadota bacterium]
MLIRWFGHSSFYIISDEGTKVITDPYEPNAFGGALGYRAIQVPADIVTISHDHDDHSYTESIPDGYEIVSRPVTKTIKGVTVKGVETYHDPESGAKRGPNIVFVIEVDHIRICHLGDLGYELGPLDLEKIGSVDILLIPVGGTYTIGPKEATRLILQMKPKIVVPMHYKTDKTTLPLGPVEDFLAGKENVARLDSSGFETIKEKLPDTTQIVVLQNEL